MSKSEVPLEVKMNFLVEAYTSAISYFDGFAGRIWTRFSILISIDSALAGLFVTLWLGEKAAEFEKLSVLVAFGILISLLMYVQSAQDKFVLEQLRSQLNRLKARIADELGLEQDLPVLFTPTELDIDVSPRFESIDSWRISAISTTRLPALISLVFLVAWLIIGVFMLRR